MTGDDARALRDAAHALAEIMSAPDRPRNFGRESFAVERIYPLSDNTAAVVYLKSSGLRALAFGYIDQRTGPARGWRFLFISYQHLAGLSRLPVCCGGLSRRISPRARISTDDTLRRARRHPLVGSRQGTLADQHHQHARPDADRRCDRTHGVVVGIGPRRRTLPVLVGAGLR